MLAVKAWLIAGTEVGVVVERRAKTSSKLPCVWSRGEFVELFMRAARHMGGLPARAGRSSWIMMLVTVGMMLLFHRARVAR